MSHGASESTRGARSGGDGSANRVLVMTRDQVRELDRLAVERFGMASIVLMEHAAIAVCDVALEMLGEIGSRRALILAGAGNNGGDGFALARLLVIAGVDARVVLTGEPSRVSGDAATNLETCRRMGIECVSGAQGPSEVSPLGAGPVLLVDAMLGTGVREAPREPVGAWIRWVCTVRSGARPVLAVDVPSGLACDTGVPAGGGDAVEADRTVTFGAYKPGLLQRDARRWVGEVQVAGIGTPRELEGLGAWVVDPRSGWRADV